MPPAQVCARAARAAIALDAARKPPCRQPGGGSRGVTLDRCGPEIYSCAGAGRRRLAPIAQAVPVSTSLSNRKLHALGLFSGLPARYGSMGALLSFGQDPRWRRAMVSAIAPRSDQRILDVATGTGLVATELVRQGAGTVVGLDQSEDMLGQARQRLAAAPELRGRITYMVGQAEHLPFADDEFDALSFTYLLRYVDDRAATMRELARVVKPGGRIGMVEFGVPRQPALRALWRVHTRVGLPLLGRAVSTAWYEVGRFLGPNIEQFHRTEPNLPGLWRNAGITDVHERHLSFGAGLVMSGVKGTPEVKGTDGHL
jgi:demethylmenaquinone methyltransferase/2-methoxy-6-polyprenyl-1,4-benzoquinol methylase